MKIRSITYFCNPKYPLDEKVIRMAGEFLAKAKSAYEAAGYEVQTVRTATIPFPKLLGEKRINDLPKLAGQLEKLIQQIGVGYLSLGPALPESPHSFEVIPEAIATSQNIFFDGVMADKSIGISLAAIKACAEVMVKSAPIDPNGFANLRFAGLANVKAGSPFFPAAYHDANMDQPAFAIATEAADLAVDAFSQAKTLEIGRQTLIAEIEKHGKQFGKVAQSLDCKFGGVDFSLGPFPAELNHLAQASNEWACRVLACMVRLPPRRS